MRTWLSSKLLILGALALLVLPRSWSDSWGHLGTFLAVFAAVLLGVERLIAELPGLHIEVQLPATNEDRPQDQRARLLILRSQSDDEAAAG